jgi:hypothetical protein
MRTLTVTIEESDFLKLGLKDREISFSELRDKISTEYAREALLKCHQIAEDTGLANMTLTDINAEIQTARNDRPF